MSEMLVSIVIPCFNAEEYVEEAIRSALEQTYSTKEVIVVDDGSTDNSLEVVRNFGEHVRWQSGPNRGACSARNAGISSAKGELIQFLDADDTLHPDKLGHMVQIAVDKGPGTLVVCDWERLDVEGNRKVREISKLCEDDEVVWCTQNQIQTASPLHWKRTLEQVDGFDESLPCAQERDLHLRLACHGFRFFHVPEVLVSTRRRLNSLSSNSVRVLRQHGYIVRKAHQLLEELDRVNDQRLGALAGMLARDARILLYEGLSSEAKEYFQAARVLHAGGGLDHAYKPVHKAVAQIVGPELFERMVAFKRVLKLRRNRRERVTPAT